MFNNPISQQKADRIINILMMNSTSKVIDIGCGEGEFLKQIHEKSKADCLGVDIDSTCIELANQKIDQLDSGKKLRFLLSDIKSMQIDRNSYDLAVCIGSSHAFGEGKSAYPNTLKQLSDLLKPNGLVLLGEGYWKQKPDQEYLDFIGEPSGIYNNHEQNIEQANSMGLIPLYTTVSNQDEWDHFEWSFLMNAELKAIAEPENKEAQAKVKNIRKWNQYYRKFGRYTMGFGFYLFLKPE
jgi:cyclopropane fatty-acyl-phospholipid synthase-like methyltransferase